MQLSIYRYAGPDYSKAEPFRFKRRGIICRRPTIAKLPLTRSGRDRKRIPMRANLRRTLPRAGELANYRPFTAQRGGVRGGEIGVLRAGRGVLAVPVLGGLWLLSPGGK